MLRAWILIFLAVPAFANIVGVDSRRSILDSDKRRALDISDTDMVRFGNATGYVDCRGRRYKNPDLGSGALIEEEDILVANAHLIVDEYRRFREPIEECFFQPQTAGAKQYQFSLEPDSYEIVTDWSAAGGANDYAVIRLKEKVAGAKAFPLPPQGFQANNGQNFVAVSAISTRPNLFDPFHPVIQGCQVRRFEFGMGFKNSTFLGDCDVELGQSGSINLIRLGPENWIAFGMIAGGGPAEMNGEEYNPAKKSFSYHVAFQDKLLDAIKRLKRRATLTSLTGQKGG